MSYEYLIFGQQNINFAPIQFKGMAEQAKIVLEGKEYEYPVITGTENEKAIDISKLRGETGYVTLDIGFKNTAATSSAITYLDGEQGLLRHRGYSIEDLADKASFTEVVYLILYGELPNEAQYKEFNAQLRDHTLVNEGLDSMFKAFQQEPIQWVSS